MKRSVLFLTCLIGTIFFVLITGCASATPSPTIAQVVTFAASYPAQVLGVVIDPEGKVLYVEPGSAAEKGGISIGDVVQKVNNLAVTSERQQIRTEIQETKKGQSVIVALQRNGSFVVLGVKPSPPTSRAGMATATPVAPPNDYL